MGDMLFQFRNIFGKWSVVLSGDELIWEVADSSFLNVGRNPALVVSGDNFMIDSSCCGFTFFGCWSN